MQALIQKILHIGITDDTSWSLSNKIQIANALMVIALPLLILNFIMNIFQKDIVGLGLCTIWTLLAFNILFLNQKKYYFTNFLFIVCIITLMSDFVYIAIGPLGNVSPMYILAILMTLFFFDKRKYVISIIGFIIINFIVVNYIILTYDTVLKEPTVPERFLYFTFSLIIMIGITLRVVQENRKRIKETETLLKELEQKNKATQRFAYITSHDLKEPIRNIASFSSLLDRKLKNNPDKEVQDYLSFIKSSAVQLNTLADSVLDYVNISNDANHELKSVELSDIITKAQNNLSNKINSSKAQIKCLKSLSFTGIENHLVILFQHLIENGIKFNQNQPPIIEIDIEETNEEYIFSIQDNGIGIDEMYFQKIFIPFKKLHNKSKYEGAGIGLAICQRIAELHHGSLSVKSNKEEGATFYLSIPKI